MDIKSILFPALSIGGLGLLFGFGLGIASKIFSVKANPLIEQVKEVLPGANCGGCGYAGCEAFAKAVVEGKAPINGCPVGGAKTTEAIAKILGVESTESVKKVAFVKCNGTCEKAKEKYIYDGVKDCVQAAALQGKGSKGCEYGCLGLGTCVSACPFNAIKIVDGVAVVDEDLCTGCGQCVAACPKNLIELVPYDSPIRVRCNSLDKGKAVKVNCEVGCIGCRLCAKVCPKDAIVIENNLAKINYDTCVNCKACVKKCPTQAIVNLKEQL